MLVTGVNMKMNYVYISEIQNLYVILQQMTLTKFIDVIKNVDGGNHNKIQIITGSSSRFYKKIPSRKRAT